MGWGGRAERRVGGAGLGVQYMPGESLHVFIDVSPLVGHNFKPSPLSPLYPPSIMFLVGCVIRFVHVCNLDFSGDYSITMWSYKLATHTRHSSILHT